MDQVITMASWDGERDVLSAFLACSRVIILPTTRYGTGYGTGEVLRQWDLRKSQAVLSAACGPYHVARTFASVRLFVAQPLQNIHQETIL